MTCSDRLQFDCKVSFVDCPGCLIIQELFGHFFSENRQQSNYKIMWNSLEFPDPTNLCDIFD
jgi:hypothetical protein